MERAILTRLIGRDGIKSIAKQLKAGRERIRAIRDRGIAMGYLDPSGQGPGATPLPEAPLPVFSDSIDKRTQRTSEADQLLAQHEAWIKDRLTAGWFPVTVFEELPCKAVTRSSFYRFLVRHKLQKLAKDGSRDSITPPIIHKPGEALLLDWGKIRDVVDPATGERRTLWAFVGVMGFSRYMMVRLVWTNSVAVTFDAIEHMLRELGGVPWRLTSDNPKCFCLTADQYDPLLNPAFVRLSQHYDFIPECLPPRDPEKKGKVERPMPFVRRLFQAYPQEFVSLEHAQAYMDRKVTLANERRHGTTALKPIDVYVGVESEKMKPLPALAFERQEVAYPVVRKDGYVRFSGKYYALGDAHIGKDAVVLATATRVSIFVGSSLTETYDRITSPHQTHATKDHLLKPWQKIEESNAHYLRRAEAIGPHCLRMIQTLLQKGDGFVDVRIIWGVLTLEKKYPRERIDFGCQTALEVGRLSSRFIERLIRLTMTHKHDGVR
jgi:transposase